MAQQEEPLYDFPEPAQPSERKWMGHQRGQGSLRSVSILDRLLLSVPVWLQLSINPATALHILQREPPGAFLVRKSRTSQRSVLCVRLADDSIPSFVQQFGIREEHFTFCLETSAIRFPDLPRLIAFYCVSRDVLPFPLELPEAIAKASSHKELESISHMGIEFWSSQLNFRGPREAPKAQKDEEKKPDSMTAGQLTAQPSPAAQPHSAPELDADSLLSTTPQTDTAANQSKSNPTLFQEFCPIRTRSPRELNCGSGLGGLCFINPLFLQSQNALYRRRMFKRSIKVRVSTETSSLLSPPLAPPPPPPLMPKTKGRCKAKAQAQGQAVAQPGEGPSLFPASPSQPTQMDPTSQDTQLQLPTQTQDVQASPQDTHIQVQVQPHPLQFLPQMQELGQTQGQTQLDPGQGQADEEVEEASTQTASLVEHLPGDSDYMQPSPRVNFSLSPSFSPYLSPSPSPKTSPSLFHKVSPSLSPHDSPSVSPSPSPKAPFSLSPFTSPSSSPLSEEAYHTPTTPLRLGQRRKEGDGEEKGAGEEEEDDDEMDDKEGEEDNLEAEEMGLLLRQIYAASMNDTDSCSSLSSLEEAAETPPPSPLLQDSGASLSQS